MSTGTIKRFFNDKGYGFISPDGGGQDIFFHYSQVEGGKSSSLKEGTKVSFNIVQGPKGQQASEIKIAEEI